MAKDIQDHENDVALWLNGQGVCSDLSATLLSIVNAGIEITDAVLAASLEGKTGAAGSVNVQGEEQKELDIITNDIVLRHLESCTWVCASVSEEIDDFIPNKNADKTAPYVVCFDPLDGSSNIETNSIIGTIFSVLELDRTENPANEADILGAANNQVAAGYVLYGPATTLVLTTGKSVAMFVLDSKTRHFVLVQSDMEILPDTAEFSINSAYTRFWEPEISAYVDLCTKGKSGPRQKDYTMRWSGAMIADVHRLFIRGGIFIYPGLNKPGSENGKLRFLYEANPTAMLVEVAGGLAHMRADTIRAHQPTGLHQRVPVILGSRSEVEILLELYQN